MIPDRIWNLEMLGFGGEGKKLGYSEKNLPELRAKERTNIKLNPIHGVDARTRTDW